MAEKKKPAKKKPVKKKCMPVYDPTMLELDDDGKPCKKCTDSKWKFGKVANNPCCKGEKPPDHKDYPNLSDDQFWRLKEAWFEFRDQYCPVFLKPNPTELQMVDTPKSWGPPSTFWG